MSFVKISNEELAEVNGGERPTGTEVMKTYATEIVKGVVVGAASGAAAGGIGAIAGAFVGAHFGANAASVKLIFS